MNTTVLEELEDFIVSGRGTSEEEFGRMADEYLKDKTEADKSEIGEAIADFYTDRMLLLTAIEYKIGKIKYAKEKEMIKTKELVMC